jgi:hypothetical protein
MIMTRQRKAPSSKKAVRRPAVRKTARTAGDEARRSRIAEAAYLLAEQRGFEGDMQIDDWLRAEQEIDARLSSSG